jgi:carboxyl-terminal processing protease
MVKQRYPIAIGFLFLAAGAWAGVDRAGAVAEMQKAMGDLGALLETNGVVFRPETLASNVLEAAVRSVDPGAAIVTPEQVERFQDEEKGVFYGVGLKLIQKGKHLVIGEVSSNGPAQAAGVPKGVYLEKINDQNAEDLTMEQATVCLRGRKNETAVLTVRATDKDAEAQVFKIKRTVMQTPVTGTQELWPQQIGYLKINGLFEGSGDEVATQLKLWSGTNCAGMILDLRGANGINLDAVSEIAGFFSHPPAPLFTLKDGLNKTLKTFTAAKTNLVIEKPVMLLVDGNTRGAAETLAAVLQDCTGVMLVGKPTRGDDRLRAPLPLAGGKMVYIAVRHIDLGKETYNGKGVQPDIEVSSAEEKGRGKESIEEELGLFTNMTEQEKQDRALNKRIGNDLILRRAADLLLGIKALNLFKH